MPCNKTFLTFNSVDKTQVYEIYHSLKDKKKYFHSCSIQYINILIIMLDKGQPLGKLTDCKHNFFPAVFYIWTDFILPKRVGSDAHLLQTLMTPVAVWCGLHDLLVWVKLFRSVRCEVIQMNAIEHKIHFHAVFFITLYILGSSNM